MKGAPMAIVLLILVSLTTLLVAGDDTCTKPPTMTWSEACHKACSTQPCNQLCVDTLRNAPVRAEVTIYALVAARMAKLKYDATIGEIGRMLADQSLPAGESEAVNQCKDKYDEARGMMEKVEVQVVHCNYNHAKQGCILAKDAVELCKNVISQWPSKLFAMVSANLDATMVVHELGALVF